MPTDKLCDKVVRDAGGTPIHVERGDGFLIEVHGKTDDEMFDFFARWLGADPEEMRRNAWRRLGSDHFERAKAQRSEIECAYCGSTFKATRRNTRSGSDTKQGASRSLSARA